MAGGKVLLTYKRKRPPSRKDISLENGHPNTSVFSITVDKHEESYEGNEENSAKDSEHAPRGKRLCSDCNKQQQCSVSDKESSRVGQKNNLICDTRKLASVSCPVSEVSPGDGGLEEALGNQLSMDLQTEGKSNSIQEGSCPYVNSYSAQEEESTEKDSVPSHVNLNNGNEPCSINLKSSMEGSPKCMVANAPEESSLKEDGLPVEDKPSSLSVSVQSKLTSPLITFRRRFKQKKEEDVLQTQNTSHLRDNCSLAIEECKSAGFLTDCEATSSKNCSVHASANLDPSQQNLDSGHSFHQCQEKRAGGDIDYNSCACARSTTKMGSVKQANEKIGKESKDNLSIIEEVLTKDSGLDLLSVQSKIDVDFQGDPTGKKCQSLSNTGSNTIRMTDEVLGSKSTLVSMDLSGPAPDSRDTVDCNIASVPSLDEQPIHSSLNSTSASPSTLFSSVSLRDKGLELLREKIGERQSLPHGQKLENGSSSADAVGGKYNSSVNSSPVLASKNYLQLFPEHISDDMTKSWQKMSASADSETGQSTLAQSRSQARNTVTKSALLLGLSQPMEQIIDSHACSSAISQWPNFCLQSRGFIQEAVPQYFPDPTSFLRHKMMLDNIVNRARTLKGNRSSYLDKYDLPISWSEEELDCLWIGVRRYGSGSWDAMLRDPRLHFLPWRTPRDLSEQWEAEQSKLFNSTPFSQVRHLRRPNVLPERLDSFWHSKTGKHVADDVQLSLGDVYSQPNDSFRKRSLSNIMDAQSNAPRHPPVTNTRTIHSLKGICRRARFENHPVLNVESSFGANPTSCMAREGNLPHWLREVVSTPLRPPDTALPSVMSSLAHSEMHRVNQPYFDSKGIHIESRNRVSNNRSIPDRIELQTGSGTQNGNPSPATAKEKLERHLFNASTQELIIINSDASSEETISDEHNVRA